MGHFIHPAITALQHGASPQGDFAQLERIVSCAGLSSTSQRRPVGPVIRREFRRFGRLHESVCSIYALRLDELAKMADFAHIAQSPSQG